MDVNRVSPGEKIAAVAAVLLFISMFFAWFGFENVANELSDQFGVDVGASSFTFNAWESFDFIDLVLTVAILAAVGTAFVRASDAVVDLPLNPAVAVLGGLATLLVLYRVIDPPGGSDREWGVFLGLILSAAVAYGGYKAMEEEGASFSGAADRLSGGGPGDPPPPPSSTPPPPPPPPGS